MDKFDRIQQLHRLFCSRKLPVPMSILVERLECSERTVHRTIEKMQCELDAPIEYNKDSNGWHYREGEKSRFELPGLWLTASELQSLSLLLNLIENIGPGLLNDELNPVEREINKLLSVRGIDPSAFREQIKILPIAHRQLPNQSFQRVSEALLKQRQLDIRYQSYSHSVTERRISPQTLIYYRENWYLDAWCHLRNELRTFSLARIQRVELTKLARKSIDKAELNTHYAKAYGIFSGTPKHTAELRFFPAIAREIAQQQWHPDQQGQWDGQDYLLSIPYSDDRELIQDILRHCPNVYVDTPAVLRKKVHTKLQSALGVFTGKRIRV